MKISWINANSLFKRLFRLRRCPQILRFLLLTSHIRQNVVWERFLESYLLFILLMLAFTVWILSEIIKLSFLYYLRMYFDEIFPSFLPETASENHFSLLACRNMPKKIAKYPLFLTVSVRTLLASSLWFFYFIQKKNNRFLPSFLCVNMLIPKTKIPKNCAEPAIDFKKRVAFLSQRPRLWTQWS